MQSEPERHSENPRSWRCRVRVASQRARITHHYRRAVGFRSVLCWRVGDRQDGRMATLEVLWTLICLIVLLMRPRLSKNCLWALTMQPTSTDLIMRQSSTIGALVDVIRLYNYPIRHRNSTTQLWTERLHWFSPSPLYAYYHTIDRNARPKGHKAGVRASKPSSAHAIYPKDKSMIWPSRF